MKLTSRQRTVLTKLQEKSDSAYGLRCSLNTIETLSRLDLIRAFGPGHIAFPRNGQWRITDAGKAALSEMVS